MNSWEYGDFAARCMETCKNYLNNITATCTRLFYVQMPFTCGYCPTSSSDFKETISHLITDHHDREIKIKRMLRALNFKIVPEMCHEQGRDINQ